MRTKSETTTLKEKTSTKFKSAADAAAHLAGDAAVEKRVRRAIHRNQIVTILLQKRVERGLTQEQVAQAMGCDASKVSRVESGNDRQLRWSDIVAYANALNLQMSLFIDDQSLSHAARIKQCIFKIDEDLNRLAELARSCKDDEKILQSIDKFYKEVLWNFALRYGMNESKISSLIKIVPRNVQAGGEPELDDQTKRGEGIREDRPEEAGVST